MSRKVATLFFTENGEVWQQYHTTVVTQRGQDANGAYVRVFAGNWLTNTTKARINDELAALGAYVFQRDFVWYIALRQGGTPQQQAIPFRDGLKVYRDHIENDGRKITYRKEVF